jgi:hypothetical protein
MKAYQIFTGDYNKHGFQYYELHSTYLSKERALEKCKEIIESNEFKNETVIESEWSSDGKCKIWEAGGWEWITICKLEEIDITE